MLCRAEICPRRGKAKRRVHQRLWQKCRKNCISKWEGATEKWDDLFVSACLSIRSKVHSIQMMNPCLIFWNASSWPKISMQAWYIRFFFPFLCACSHHTDWPVICESPMVSLIIHDRPTMDPQHSIWIIKWQAKHINGWQTGCVWPRAREELQHNSFPLSVNPRTANTSVARRRVFHQHNVWRCLRQMLSWDVTLTFTTFSGEKRRHAGVFD